MSRQIRVLRNSIYFMLFEGKQKNVLIHHSLCGMFSVNFAEREDLHLYNTNTIAKIAEESGYVHKCQLVDDFIWCYFKQNQN